MAQSRILDVPINVLLFIIILSRSCHNRYLLFNTRYLDNIVSFYETVNLRIHELCNNSSIYDEQFLV